MELFRLDDQVAVVIGATGALGGAIASGFAQLGASVAVMGRDPGRGEQRVQAIAKEGGRAVFVPVDVTSRDSIESARAEAERKLGAAHVLVNAAGGNSPRATVTADRSVVELAGSDWSENFDMNLTGAVLQPCQVFGAGMVERGAGSIINIASVAAHIPLSRVAAYAAAKAAVLNLTQFLAREWGECGVRVNSLTPGFFPAEQNRRLLYDEDGRPTERAQNILAHTPMRRFGDPSELVGAAAFLACDRASSFVTGSDVRVDGGFLSQTI